MPYCISVYVSILPSGEHCQTAVHFLPSPRSLIDRVYHIAILNSPNTTPRLFRRLLLSLALKHMRRVALQPLQRVLVRVLRLVILQSKPLVSTRSSIQQLEELQRRIPGPCPACSRRWRAAAAAGRRSGAPGPEIGGLAGGRTWLRMCWGVFCVWVVGVLLNVSPGGRLHILRDGG